MKGKRILSAVLSAALLLQLSPLAAFAEDTLPLSDTATTVQTEPAPEDLAIDAQIAPEPTAETPAEPTAEPTPEASEEPTATPTPEPTAEPTATPAAEESAPDAAETPAPEPSAEPTAAPDPAAAVQALIDALPDEVTEDNAAAVEQALTDIDDAKQSLTDDELAGLDFSRYDAAANALLALWGEAPTDEVETLDNYQEPGKYSEGYYQITNESELRWFAQAVNGGKKSIKARLMNDITVDKNTQWTPIGTERKPFEGTFDGNGKTITGLTCTDQSKDYVGLVGYADSATIQNVTVKDSNFNGNNYIGAVCGFILGSTFFGGTITGCTNSGSTVKGWANSGSSGDPGRNIGGIVGRAKYATVQRCVNTGDVTGINYLGGIVGCTDNATVQDCGNTGNVKPTGIGRFYGGITGSVPGTSYIYNCYNADSSTADKIYGNGSCSHSNCYYLANNTGSSGSTVTGTTPKTQAQFASGEVAFLLQNGRTDAVWGQTLTGESPQALPVLGGAKVYQTTPCTAGYSNTQGEDLQHNYVDGVCSRCGEHEPPALDNGYYKITNQWQLYWFANQVNNKGKTNINAKLINNITINSGVLNNGELNTNPSTPFAEWTPMGTNTKPFTGTFDGNNKTISGLYFNDSGKDDVGLFGCVGTNGTVKDVTLADSYVSGNNSVGGICGYNDGGILQNCHNAGRVSGTGDYTGGVCGENHSGTLENSYNTGKVSGTGNLTGGVCGQNGNNSTVKLCYNTGEVSGTRDAVGGVCGVNLTTVNGCYNTGKVSGNNQVGGVCGNNESGATLENSYNTNTVSGETLVGGVCGQNGFTVKGCYNTGEVSGYMLNVGGVCGANTGTLENSYNTNTVSGEAFVGGVCGENNSTVSGCYNTGEVSGKNECTGGVCGANTGTLENSYNTNTVSGDSNVGGVCGENNRTVSGCYNTGKVSGTEGLVGSVCGNNYANVENCYYLAGTSEKAVGGEIGISTNCESKTKLQFRNGAVAYQLQKDLGEGAEQVWGQRIGTDKTPVLSSDSTYAVHKAAEDSPCPGGYSNTNGEKLEHKYQNGVCIYCGDLQQADEVDGYYRITNQGQLRWFANQVNNEGRTDINALLTENITMDGTEWTPIGTEQNPFTGKFDGNGKTITGLTCTDESKDYVGLVGYANGAVIQNVTVQDAALKGHYYIGTVCGYITGGTITNCHAVNTAIGGNTEGRYYGGIAGYITGKTNVTGCTNSDSTVNGGYYLGGIAGYAANTTVQCCFNSGAVTCKYAKSGGIVGLTSDATVQDCGNTGAVTKPDYNNRLYGGIVGEADSELTIQNCYNTDSNTAAKICGDGWYSYSNCYYLPGDTGSSGSTDQGITAKTAEQFASGEVAYLLQNGREQAVWGQKIDTDDYPKLGGDKVYQSAPCTADYSNTEIPPKQHVIGNDGKCTDCGELCIAYTVTIPATVELGTTATIKAKDVILPNNKTLNVKVADDSVFTVSLYDGTNVVDTQTYTVTKEDKTEVTRGSTVLTAENGDTDKQTSLTFNTPASTTYSGEYKGTVKFTVSVDNKAS